MGLGEGGNEYQKTRCFILSFIEAMTAFHDPFSMNMPDPDHSDGERRFLILAASDRYRLLVVSYAGRSSRIRIISARLATSRERKEYEEEEWKGCAA